MSKPYTKIQLDKLDKIRAELHKNLNPYGFTLRTFYLGPRRIRRDGVAQGTTNKDDAYAAKIGIYKMNQYGASLIGYYNEVKP